MNKKMETDEECLTPGQVKKNRLKLKIAIPAGSERSVSGDEQFYTPSIEPGFASSQAVSTPMTAAFHSINSSMTSSPLIDDEGRSKTDTPDGTFPTTRRSSAGRTPGGGSAFLALTGTTIRWTAREIKRKVKHKNTRLLERPATPFPNLRSKNRATPKGGSSKKVPPSVPVVLITPASLQRPQTFDGGSISASSSVSQIAGPDPSPIVSDFCSSEPRHTPKLPHMLGTSSLLAPHTRYSRSCSRSSDTDEMSIDQVSPPSAASTSGAFRDSAIASLEEVSYVSGVSMSRSTAGERLTPSSYIRSPRRASKVEQAAERDESNGSAIGQGGALAVFTTIVLALAVLGMATSTSLLGATLPAIHSSTGMDLEATALLVSSRAVGGIVGVLALFRYYDDVVPNMSSCLALISSGVITCLIPRVQGETGLNVLLFFNGIGLAHIMCASGAISLHLWSSQYLTPTIITQLFLSVGLVLGPITTLPTALELEKVLSENYSSYLTTQGKDGITHAWNISMRSEGLMNGLVLEKMDIDIPYLVAGAVCCLAGVLFFTSWIVSGGPTFYNRSSSFDFRSMGGDISRKQKVSYCVYVMFAISLATVQFGMEATYQNILLLYLAKGVSSYCGTMALYMLITHHGGVLVGRILGVGMGIFTTQTPVLIFGGIGTLAAFIAQFLLIGQNHAATWVGPALSGVSIGAFMPSLVRQMEKTVTMSRQVAGGMLGGCYVGQTVLPIITGHLMMTQARESFHIVLLVSASLIFFLLTGFLCIDYRLAEIIKTKKLKNAYMDVIVDPNENVISRDAQGRRPSKSPALDANGNVITNEVKSDQDGMRIRGDPYSMTALCSLGSRAVLGRW